MFLRFIGQKFHPLGIESEIALLDNMVKKVLLAKSQPMYKVGTFRVKKGSKRVVLDQKGQKRALIFELFLSPFRALRLKYGIHCDKTDSVGLRKGAKKVSKRGPWPGSELGLPRVRPGFDPCLAQDLGHDWGIFLVTF